MTRVRVGLLGMAIVAMGAVPVWAQAPQDVWQVSVDFLVLATRGNDVHVGDVFTEGQRLTGTVANSTFNYGVTYDPIALAMKTDPSVLVAARYRGQRWGFGVRGWQVRTDAAVDGDASSASPTATSQSVTGIRMWDHSLIPVADDDHASGFSPVSYEAENSLRNLRIEGYAERRWIAGPDLNVATRFGVTHARLENLRTESQRQNAFTVDTVGASTTTLSNSIRIASDSEATMNLTGALLGLAGDASFRRLRVEWLASQAVLMGTARTSGEWTDVDDITEVTVTGGSQVQTSALLNGLIPTTGDDRVIVPVLDLQVKASVHATRAVRVGVGLLSSTWFHLPVAPAFSVPGDWTDVAGTGWQAQQRDITFTAVSVFAGWGF